MNFAYHPVQIVNCTVDITYLDTVNKNGWGGRAAGFVTDARNEVNIIDSRIFGSFQTNNETHIFGIAAAVLFAETDATYTTAYVCL